MTTTLEIRDYLHENSPWLDRERTVDTVKAGDATRTVQQAGVCWYASLETIEAAHRAGCDLLICHEPTFWEHSPEEKTWRTRPPGSPKQAFLEDSGMTVLRAHDSWDQWPEIGIRESWARFLGFQDRVYASEDTESHAFRAIYRIPEQPLRDLAQYIADRIKPLGEDSVQVMGDPDRLVKHPALGVGCIGPDSDCVARGADALIVCYDGAPYWQARERLYEQGAAIIAVEHGTCEMPGLESLCQHLAEMFPDINFQYFAEHPRTWTVQSR